MKALLTFLLLLASLLLAQKPRLMYGIAVNKGLERVYPEDRSLDVNKRVAFGYYFSLGLTKAFDSTFLFYGGLRYGRENSRFRIHPATKDLDYRVRNNSLSFIFSPGVKLNKRQSLFLDLAIVRVLQANSGGGGSGERGGKFYTYEYIPNLPHNTWEFRPGLRWMIKPDPEKRLSFEAGVEPSFLTRKLEMKLRDPNTNLPGTVYNVQYELILFYTGIRF